MALKTVDYLNLTIQEYSDIFCDAKQKRSVDWKHIERKLQNEMAWTEDGAKCVAALVREYGSFILRNALALANVLGIEDGQLGF